MRKLECLYSHTDFYIYLKPAELSFHSEDGPGFVARVESQTGEKLFPVHRLDKVTSGLVILARNKPAASAFGELFEQKKIDKFYLAVSLNKPKKKQGWVKGDMAKARRGSYKLMPSLENPAVTRFYSKSIAPGVRAFILKPFTGKTHQLRVALKSLAAPIAGDIRYGAKAADRVYLHAFALSFDWQGEKVRLASLTEDGALFAYLNRDNSEINAWLTPWALEW